jgi:hypothetical protein
MSWTIDKTTKLFKKLLIQSKEFYKEQANIAGTLYYTEEDQVTSEEMEMACMIIQHLGGVL